MKEHDQQLLQKAIQAYKRQDQESARQFLRTILLNNPKHVSAWLWMSAVVEGIDKQRECLERAIEIDSTCEPAHKGLEMLRLKEAATTKRETSEKSIEQVDVGQQRAQRLGDYLVEHNIITLEQLNIALREQQNMQQGLQGVRVPLGDVLLKLGFLNPAGLANILIVQQQDRINAMGIAEGQSPEFLGEYLVTKGIITHDQLKTVLAEQMRLRQIGKKMLLGELLVHAGYISPDNLEHVLDQQRADVFRRFAFDEKDE
jgi:hypothetical protein